MFNSLLESLPFPPRIPLMGGPTPIQRSRLAWGDDTGVRSTHTCSFEGPN